MSKSNLANAILAAPVEPGDTSAALVTGYGATMPAPPFKLTFTPFGQLSTKGNSEIVLVTAVTGDILTIERAKGGTSARSFETGDIASNGIYIETSTAVGDIFMSLRELPEAGRLFMAGGTFNKSDYPLLYKHVQDNPAYGTTGGASGSETFTLADMRERMPFGKSSNSPFTTLGAKAGTTEETLTISQIPSHGHGQRLMFEQGIRDVSTGSTGSIGAPKYLLNSSQGGSNPGGPLDTHPAGGGNAHNNMPPYIVVNYEVVCG